MRLKMFIWHNPTTEMPEKVYEFPLCCASQHEIREHGGRNMFSSSPLEYPLLFILPNYLTEIPEQRHAVENEALHVAIRRVQQMEQASQL